MVDGQGFETEPNGFILQADNIPPGVVVDGQINNSDWDYFWLFTDAGIVTITLTTDYFQETSIALMGEEREVDAI